METILSSCILVLCSSVSSVFCTIFLDSAVLRVNRKDGREWKELDTENVLAWT